LIMAPHETQRGVLLFATPEDVAVAAAEKFVAYGQESISQHGVFSVALAGGNTPRRVYELLASDRFKDLIDWSKVHLFFSDERSVPPNHPDSNYAMAVQALISKIGIPPANVHRIAGEVNPEESAAAYEGELRNFFGGVATTRFDLVLLGMGDDGHTASLFPNSDSLNETSRWVVATKAPSGQDRISLTLAAIKNGAHVLFLVTGSAKAQRLAEVLGDRPGTQLPAQLIMPVNGTLEWLVDEAAAALLSSHLAPDIAQQPENNNEN
jgi:6-phosphogluconolactonase